MTTSSKLKSEAKKILEHYKEGRIKKEHAEKRLKKLLEKAKGEKTKKSILAYLGALKRKR